MSLSHRYFDVSDTKIADKGYTNRTSWFSVLHGLVYTHPSMAANLLFPPGSALFPEALTSFVLPIHNQGVSFAP